MVRLRFTRMTSSSSSSPGDVTSITSTNSRNLLTTTPQRTLSASASNEENVLNRGNVRTTVVARGAATARGDARENRPSSQESKATKRAAKKVLKLLDSPRKVIMSRAKSVASSSSSSSSSSSTLAAGRGGAGARGSSSNAGAAVDRPALAGRSSSVPTGLGVAPPSSVAERASMPAHIASGAGSVVSYRQVSPNHSGGIFRTTGSPRSASGGKYGNYELFGDGATTGFPVQQEAYFDPLNDGTAMALAASRGCLKDDGSGGGGGGGTDVLRWLHDEAPQDILPRVLSFAGSRRIDALSRTCKSWRSLTLSDAVWRTACEDTGKWRAGQPPPRGTWLQHYRDSPLVPVDYDTLEGAFLVNAHDGSGGARRGDATRDTDANNIRPVVPEHRRSVRVLLRPGKYVLRESLVVHSVGDKRVTIETAEAPGTNDDDASPASSQGFCVRQNLWLEDALMMEEEHHRPAEDAGDGTASTASSSGRGTPSRLSRRATSLRNLLSCRSTANDDVLDHSVHGVAEGIIGDVNVRGGMAASMPNLQGYGLEEAASAGGGRLSYASARFERHKPKRAILVLKTRKHNEPIIRVRQGTVCLNNLDLIHNSSGTDIWNGNSAVQVQPPFDEQDNPLTAAPPSIQPTAVLNKVNIMSVSGRGVVNIDGGYASINDCYIHNCAATGIYVGGPGSVADVLRTDVVHNGNGNSRSRRGIARGHSGVYLEQGVATLRDCNVSDNSLTGISAVSSDNATLTVEDTDLMSNGSIQLELPPLGSASHRRSVSRNNSVSAAGRARPRSGLMALPPPPPSPSAAGGGGSGSTPRRRRRTAADGGGGRDRPQSPAEDAAGGNGGADAPRSPPAAAAANIDAAAATASARRRMRFAALDEGHLAPAGGPPAAAAAVVPMVE